ncbi:MAG: cysteine--tRNA ligase [Burkholderiales bacterium]|nr:cysteine--tRNA ligase [Burkholderiales bacterium]OUT76389.1 MAG: cysteine--tRNA ligase [Betaproteobacteria bacterium TMED22]
MLKIFNSLTRNKDVFKPIQDNSVRMYVCGMTVYDFCHLGHARVMIVFDLVRRWLQASGYEVLYIRNITDIDDKIINRANENQESFLELTERYIEAMNEDALALGVTPPDAEPKASDNIPQMISLIEKLFEKGFAYGNDNGDVYYSVNKFERYGRLSGKSLEALRAGERVDINHDKRHPMDFVLWKGAKPEEPSWSSPWGMGRPGWHIECSAMSERYLGAHFDIHGGGQDLQFPHHENEIAQSEGAHNHDYVNYWMHNGFVRVDDQKMSKSLGNFFTVREILKKYDAEVVRYFVLRAHYRSPLNYSDQHLNDAKASLSRLYIALKNVDGSELTHDIDWIHPSAAKFKLALDDDFNTAEAISVLFDLASELNRGGSVEIARLLKGLSGILGLLKRDPSEFLQSSVVSDLSTGDIEGLIAKRDEARANRNFAEADQLRQHLLDAGIVLEDSSGKTTWRRS